MTWDEVKEKALLETLSREILEQRLRKKGKDGELCLRLARVCVRDHRLLDALNYYEQAELLGETEAAEERAVIARHIGDFPDTGSRLA